MISAGIVEGMARSASITKVNVNTITNYALFYLLFNICFLYNYKIFSSIINF